MDRREMRDEEENAEKEVGGEDEAFPVLVLRQKQRLDHCSKLLVREAGKTKKCHILH